MRTASEMTYGHGVLAHTAPGYARILHGLRVPETARPGGYGRRGRFVPGHQSPMAWRYSFLEVRFLCIDLIGSLRTHRHTSPPSSMLSLHRDQYKGSCRRERSGSGWLVPTMQPPPGLLKAGV